MFTPLQLSQLAAAAWSGPSATIIAGVEHYAAASGHTATTYTVSYHVGQVCYLGRTESPFTAIAQAASRFAAEGATISEGASVQAHAARTVAAAEALFTPAAVPAAAPPVVACAACGEGRDHFGECGCAYVPLTHYARA